MHTWSFRYSKVRRNKCRIRETAEAFLLKSRELSHAMLLQRPSWKHLLSQISEQQPGPLRDALHFTLLVSLSRAQDLTYLHSSSKHWAGGGAQGQDPDDSLVPWLFQGMAELYAARVRSLYQAMPRQGTSVCVHRCDNRILRLAEPVDAIITGPPYPGVYDYHAPASASADLLGGPILYDFCAPGYTVGGGRVPVLAEEEDHLRTSSSQYAPGRETLCFPQTLKLSEPHVLR